MKFIISFLFMFSCFANFSGQWTGQGFYEYNQSDGSCSEVFMQLKVIEDKLYIEDGGYICGTVQASYPSSSFDIQDGELIYFGEKVGEYSEDSINLEYDNGEYHLSLRKFQGQILYSETWDDGSDYLRIDAKLNLLL